MTAVPRSSTGARLITFVPQALNRTPSNTHTKTEPERVVKRNIQPSFMRRLILEGQSELPQAQSGACLAPSYQRSAVLAAPSRLHRLRLEPPIGLRRRVALTKLAARTRLRLRQ